MIFQQYPEILFATSQLSEGNMSFNKGDPHQALINRQKFLNKFGLEPSQIICPNLQLGNEVAIVKKSDLGQGAMNRSNQFNVDGLITNHFGVNLFILTGDCHAIALYDPQQKVVGLIHAGRPGLEKEILLKAVKTMVSAFNCSAQDILAQFGPSIGPCCYKPAYPDKSSPQVKKYIVQNQGEYAIDIWSWGENQLIEAGIKKINIDNPQICTYHNHQYFSYRRSQNENSDCDYRFATLFGLKYKT